MSAPAKYVSVRDGSWTLWHHNLGAYEVLEVSVLGPAVTGLFLDSWDKMSEPYRQDYGPAQWDDCLCEGGLLVDWDSRVVLVFTVYRDQAFMDAYLAAAVSTWPGWNVRWADDGIRDLAAHVGIDPDSLNLQRPPTVQLEAATDGAQLLAAQTGRLWALFLAEDIEGNLNHMFQGRPLISSYTREGGWFVARQNTRVTRVELAAVLEAIMGSPQPVPCWRRLVDN